VTRLAANVSILPRDKPPKIAPMGESASPGRS